MKYLKTFENNKYNFDNYRGKIFINTPPTEYFKSTIALQVIFVDDIKKIYYAHNKYNIEPFGEEEKENRIGMDACKIESDAVVQCNIGGSMNYTDWDQEYTNWEFDKIKFMTPEEFYKNHKDLFIRILEKTMEESKNNLKTEWYKKRIKFILDKLTIPETEHIISANKYNL